MSFRGIDGANDWFFGQGVQSYFTKNDEIAANIKTTLQTFLQECFFDPNFGVPWFGVLGQKNPQLLLVALRTAIAGVTGVTGINDVEYNLTAERVAQVRYNINTIYTTQLIGQVNLQ